MLDEEEEEELRRVIMLNTGTRKLKAITNDDTKKPSKKDRASLPDVDSNNLTTAAVALGGVGLVEGGGLDLMVGLSTQQQTRPC
eukprot:1193568-Prorocentrum_minimum.AAC.1